MEDLTFEQIADFVRERSRIPEKTSIVQSSRFGRDLRITGDDGGELLEAVEKRIEVTFTRETFDLHSKEFLFHGKVSKHSRICY